MTTSNNHPPLLPVTVLSGFLGAGKTTLLSHLLNNRDGLRCALIVNDVSEVNIDSELITHGATKLNRAEEKLVEMSNGCICCTLREDLMEQVAALADEQRFDYLIIESSGISEPMPVAATFAFVDENGRSLSQKARLDTMVTVVDAAHFLSQLQDAEDLLAHQAAASPDGDRTIADLLIEQVEFANVIVLNKTDLVDDFELGCVHSLLQKLNPQAKIIHSRFGKVSLHEVLNTQLFSFAEAELIPGWARELAGEHTPETEEYGISSFVYRADRPFHPERFYTAIREEWEGVIRSKGFFWLASRPDLVGIWSQAGGACRTEPGGYWNTRTEENQNELDADHKRQQLLVCIGIDLDQKKVTRRLDQCLLNDEEMKLSAHEWMRLNDPFPVWSTTTSDS